MKITKKWRNQADTFHLVYGISIIVLAVVVALLAHAVITGEDFLGSGWPTPPFQETLE